MISNLPTGENFRSLAQDCLIQTSNNLFEITRNYTEFRDDIYVDLDEADLWDHHSGDLRTCFVLLYQAFELYLKAEICDESPYLLLETPRKDWPTSLESRDKDFNELFTISGEQLLKTFNAVYGDSKKKRINEIFNELRKKRNAITHSSSAFSISPEYLLKTQVESFFLFEGFDQWWNQTKINLVTHPMFGYGDYDSELAGLTLRLAFIRDKIGIKFLNKFSEFNLLARKYHCPHCSRYLSDEGLDNMERVKWSILNPNTPNCISLLCYSCQETFAVERRKCNNDRCNGNVISDENVCMSCFKDADGDS